MAVFHHQESTVLALEPVFSLLLLIGQPRGSLNCDYADGEKTVNVSPKWVVMGAIPPELVPLRTWSACFEPREGHSDFLDLASPRALPPRAKALLLSDNSRNEVDPLGLEEEPYPSWASEAHLSLSLFSQLIFYVVRDRSMLHARFSHVGVLLISNEWSVCIWAFHAYTYLHIYIYKSHAYTYDVNSLPVRSYFWTKYMGTYFYTWFTLYDEFLNHLWIKEKKNP